jgi:transposase
MNSGQLFTQALGLLPPWYVERIEFKNDSKGRKHLDIYVRFKKGSKFKDEQGVECPVYDTLERSWQHLNFFEHTCYLHAKVPRIRTSSGQIKQVQVPWARAHSGFTLLFEAYVMSLIESEMPVNKIASLLGVLPKRIWTIFNYWLARAYHADDQSSIKTIGIDETSRKKGHDYLMITADLDKRRVVFACPGKDEKTIGQLAEHFKKRKIPPEQIERISMDMSPAFMAGASKYFPDAKIVFDRFHIKKLLNEAVDQVRKSERRLHNAIKGHKYTFLKNPRKLTKKQKHAKQELMETFPALATTVRLQELFDDFFEFCDQEKAAAFLAYWCDLAEESKILPMMKFAAMIKGHWTGIINYVQAKISNGILESINSKIQLAKRRARGYRNEQNLINMIYFIAGKLEFDYPHFST